MKRFNQYWILVAAILLLQTAGNAVNINGKGVSLNLLTTDLSSVVIQSNSIGARLMAAGTPAFGIVSANGAEAKVIIEPMNALAANGNSGTPVADFSADPLTGAAPLDVQFMDLSSGGVYEILSWTWDFGDGSTYSADQDPVHTYDMPGTYTVSLTILTTAGPAYTVRDNYITVVQAVPALGGSGLMLLIATVSTGSIVLLRKKGARVSGHKD